MLTSQQHQNQQGTHEDLHTNRNLIRTIVTLLHDILAKLNETTKTQPQNQAVTEPEQPMILNTTSTPKTEKNVKQEKQSKPPPQTNHNETLHPYVSQQLHSLSQQVEQMRQPQPQHNIPRYPN